jgi:hypothetical protein
VVSIVPGDTAEFGRTSTCHRCAQAQSVLNSIAGNRSVLFHGEVADRPGLRRNQSEERGFKPSRSTRDLDIRSNTGTESAQSPDARRPQAISGHDTPRPISTEAQSSPPSLVSSASAARQFTVAIDCVGPDEVRAASSTVAVLADLRDLRTSVSSPSHPALTLNQA